MMQIYELADSRKSDALIPYFANPDASLREAAALAYASIQDTTAIDELFSLVLDPEPSVRVAAVYAIGQTGYSRAIVQLVAASELEKDELVDEQILEAVGKLTGNNFAKEGDPETTEAGIRFLDNSRFETEGERIGWAKGAFWIHLSGMLDERLMNRMPFVLQKTGGDSRVACAHAMARYQGAWFINDKNKKYIMQWCRTERNSDVRMLQMTMLGKVNDLDAKNLLLGYLNTASQDQHVRVAAIRAAAKMQFVTASELLPLLDESDEYLILECLSAMTKKEDLKEVLPQITEKCETRGAGIRSFAMKLNALQNPGKLGDAIWSSYDAATTPYEKVYYAHALGAAPEKATDCIHSLMEEKEYAVKYALMEALIEMHHQKNWPAQINYQQTLLEIFNQNDIGCQALISAEFRSMKLTDQEKNDVIGVLQPAIGKLSLPREIETCNEIIRTINAISKEKMAEKTAELNHPIDWAMVSGISTNQKAKVSTSKGDFIIELRVNDAPGSVASFVSLAKSGFYNDKYFHRVIPNFVIQGGCPRGDGMGGTDYTLRSEFALHDYRPGAVGLASSGRDTESCQWFVSHTNTPHLEGRYSIFGYVISGMDIVNKILVGDKILNVEIQ